MPGSPIYNREPKVYKSMFFTLVFPHTFNKQFQRLPLPVKNVAKKTLRLLSENPKHPSLKTHKVNKAVGDYGGNVFEAYVNQKYRLTWEYGPETGQITLRNIDNHDECLQKA